MTAEPAPGTEHGAAERPATQRPLRLFLGAFGDPGHAFPMLALGSRLAARGHEVTLETWARWRPEVEAAGMRFAAAPEYPVFPTRERPLQPYQAVVRAAAETRPALVACAPDVVVHDILTLAPAMAAGVEKRLWSLEELVDRATLGHYPRAARCCRGRGWNLQVISSMFAQTKNCDVACWRRRS